MSPPLPSKFWQFSIREFFLAVIAISSLMALYVSQRTFEPTLFSESFGPTLIVENAMKQLGATGQGGSGGGGSTHSAFVSSSYRASYQNVVGTTQPKVMDKMLGIIKQQILDAGCTTKGTGTTLRGEEEMLTEFEVEYQNKNATGQIRVRAIRGERGDWQFWFDIFEF